MNRRIDISRSYFINKSTIKKNIKYMLEHIKTCRFFISILEKDPKYEDLVKRFEILIIQSKEEINKETNIYFY